MYCTVVYYTVLYVLHYTVLYCTAAVCSTVQTYIVQYRFTVTKSQLVISNICPAKDIGISGYLDI